MRFNTSQNSYPLQLLVDKKDDAFILLKYGISLGEFFEQDYPVLLCPGDIVSYCTRIGGRFDELEELILQNPDKSGSWCYFYVLDVLKRPWPEAEHILAKNPIHAIIYARDILKGRFIRGEVLVLSTAWKNYYENAMEIVASKISCTK